MQNEDELKDLHMVRGLKDAEFKIDNPSSTVVYFNRFLNLMRKCVCIPVIPESHFNVVNVKIWGTDLDTLVRAAHIAQEIHGSPIELNKKEKTLQIYYIHKKSIIVGALHGKFPKWLSHANGKEEVIELEDIKIE